MKIFEKVIKQFQTTPGKQNTAVSNSLSGLNKSKDRRGFALIFTVFLGLAITLATASSFTALTRYQNGIQHSNDLIKTRHMREAMTARLLYELSAYVKTNGWFPDESVRNSYITQVNNWYGNLKNNSSYKDSLKTISLMRIDSFRESERDVIRGYAKYDVAVKSKTSTTKVENTLVQKLKVSQGKLFDFAVFCDQDCEIAPGPNQDLQAPVFANGNIYLMTDKWQALNFRPAKNIATARENYVLRSHKRIYFGFKRALAVNYLMDISTYSNSVPSYYKTYQQSGKYLEADPAYNLNHPYPWDNLSDRTSVKPAPRFYYFYNGAFPQDNANNISVDGKSLTLNLPPLYLAPHNSLNKRMTADGIYNSSGLAYSYASMYSTNIQNPIHVSTAFNPAKFPALTPFLDVYGNPTGQMDEDSESTTNPGPALNPKWTTSDHPYFPGLVQQQKDKLSIPLGDPTSSNVHVLIDPVQSKIFPASAPDPLDKFRFQSGPAVDEDVDFFDIYCKDGCLSPQLNKTNSNLSDDFRKLIDPTDGNEGAIKLNSDFTMKTYVDFRTGVNTAGRDKFYYLELDMKKLLEARPPARQDKGLLVYVHTYPMQYTGSSKGPQAVRLINGERVPKEGITVVTNGRLWIQGNYNTFSYSTNATSISKGAGFKTCAELNTDEDDPNCHCSVTDWENENCKVPPAAVFSDSFGMLSPDFQNNYIFNDPPYKRTVLSDMMVNTALATGFLSSRLAKVYNTSSWSDQIPDDKPAPVSNWGWKCDAGLESTGLPKQSKNCEFYKDGNIYYVNKDSDSYEIARSRNANLPEEKTPTQDMEDKVDRIPIFADATQAPFHSPRNNRNYDYINDLDSLNALKPVPKFPGIYFVALYRPYLFTSQSCSVSLACAGSQTTCCANPPASSGILCTDPGLRSCNCPSGETTTPPSCGSCQSYKNCVDSGGEIVAAATPRLIYYYMYSSLLYTPYYSGGIENLINFQENWTGKTVRFSGTLSAPWLSEALYKSVGGLAYYGMNYYTAPIRHYDFNEDLAANPPPATPKLFSVKYLSWEEIS